MRFKTIFIAMSLIFCLSATAADFGEYREKLRPWLTKVIGVKWTDKLLGEKQVNIELPPFPKIESDAKSIASYDRSPQKGIKALSTEEEQRFNYLFINELFLATRMVRPTDNELAKWMNVMNQGATREGVYRAVVLDDHYAGLENYNSPINDSSIAFAVDYSERFLGRGIKREAMEKINFYTLKRILVDKTLELIDAFPQDSDHQNRWYAVFSAELAQKFSQLWSNKMRQNTSREEHKVWADSVPAQHLKSEVIIKLHFVFNFLNS